MVDEDLKDDCIVMTAEIPMSPRSTDDWVETLQHTLQIYEYAQIR